MTKEQLEALLNYIDARIEEKIASDHGREALHEYMRASAFKDDLLVALFGDEQHVDEV